MKFKIIFILMTFYNQIIFIMFQNKIDFLMKFHICNIDKTPLYMACDKGNVELVKLLLNRKEININDKSVLKDFKFFIQFRIKIIFM